MTNSSCILKESLARGGGELRGRGRAQGKVQGSGVVESPAWMELGNSGDRGSWKGLGQTLERATSTLRSLDFTQQSVESPMTENVPVRSKAERSNCVGLVPTKPHPSQPVPEAR